MAAQRIRYDSEQMRSAAAQIRKKAEEYASASSKFITAFRGATEEWEGASKQKMLAFVEGPVNDYMNTTVGQLLDALAKLLEANADQMEQADQEIANSIPESLG